MMTIKSSGGRWGLSLTRHPFIFFLASAMSYSYIQIDPRLIKLDELVETYHRKTDAHDDRICTGYDERDRCSMPATRWQFNRVNAYAKQLFKELVEEARANNITPHELLTAIQKHR